MRLSTRILLLIPLLLPLGAMAADEEQSREKVVKTGKPATALVECVLANGRGYGSAFCLHSSGLFVTNAHVVSASGPNGISLILDPGLKMQRVVKAKVLRLDKEKDLALLRAEDVKDLPALSLGSIEGLQETQGIVAFGFPFGTLLGENRRDYPAVSVNVGTITSLRHRGGALHRIQTDAVLNPGNSGGPVLDRSGNVIGVVVAGLRGAGVNFIIPVSHVTEFLARPELEFKLPTVAQADIHKEIAVEAKAVSLIPQTKPLRLELLLRSEDGKERKVPMELQDGVYRARVIPVPMSTEVVPLRVTVTYAKGSVTGTTMDRALRIDGKEQRLSQVRGLRWQPRPQVILEGGKTTEGVVTGLDTLEVDLGKEVLRLNLAAAVSAQFEVNTPAEVVTCTVVVLQDAKEVGRQSSNLTITTPSLPVSETPGIPATVMKPPTLDQDRVVKTLPSTVADAAVGGGGRYLVLHFPTLRKLGIFDVTEAKIVGYIPLADDNVKFAAGQDKLVVVLPTLNILQRWDLATRTRDLSVPFQAKAKIQLVAMGSASQGPLLMSASDGPARAEVLFIDLRTLKQTPLEMVGDRVMHADADTPLRASANGKVFASWRPNSSPQDIQTMVLEGAQVRVYLQGGKSVGHTTPGPDGRFLYTGRGLYTQQGKAIGAEEMRNPYLIPAVQGPYYLSLSINAPGAHNPKPPVAIHLAGTSQPLVTLTDVDVPEGINGWDRERFQSDRRILFIPDAKVLITIPTTNDKLVLHRVDVDKLLEKSDTDYLFVMSQPQENVRKGTAYRYQLAVKSRKGGVTYKLDSGPEGMTVTPDGLVRWDVPADCKEADTTVLLNVSDKSGQEVFHTYKIVIQP